MQSSNLKLSFLTLIAAMAGGSPLIAKPTSTTAKTAVVFAIHSGNIENLGVTKTCEVRANQFDFDDYKQVRPLIKEAAKETMVVARVYKKAQVPSLEVFVMDGKTRLDLIVDHGDRKERAGKDAEKLIGLISSLCDQKLD